jgi:D-arabinose 1-dehydrogenase-like Zn-dependent alcohol dehydrogenase
MLGKRDDEPVELECPVCGTDFKTTESEAAKGKVRCPRGHEFAVMGMLGGSGDPDARGRS